MRCVHCNCQLHIKVLYVLVTLLFLILLVNSFLFIYIPQFFERRLLSTDNEISYSNSNDKSVAKRETSFADGKDCGDNCTKDDIIVLKGNWHVKKSDLWEYCFRADNFCQRFNSTSKENVSDSDEENVKNETYGTKLDPRIEDCVLYNIEKPKILQFPIHKFTHPTIMVDPFQNESDNEYTIWSYYFQYYNVPILKLTEYRVNRNFSEYRIVGHYDDPQELGLYGLIYNGSIFGQYKREKKIIKYNFATTEKTIKELDDGFENEPYIRILFRSDENGLWIIYEQNFPRGFVLLRINPENLEILWKQKLNVTETPSEKRHLENVFIAYGRIYYVTAKFFTRGFIVKVLNIDLMLDIYEENFHNISLNEFTSNGVEFAEVTYNYKTQELYLFDLSTFRRYKLHFHCLK